MTKTEARQKALSLGREEYRRKIASASVGSGYKVKVIMNVGMMEAWLAYPGGGILPNQGGPLISVPIG